MQSYPESIEYLYGLQHYGIKLGLETTEALLDRSGSPHRRYPALHIGGTNGKGATAAMGAAVLQAAGVATAPFAIRCASSTVTGWPCWRTPPTT